MGRYEHLPIYKQSFNLLVELHKLVPTFPKKYKFSLGSSIIEDLNSILKWDLNSMTPIEVFNKFYKLQKSLKNKSNIINKK